jgi:RNA polymerase sigma-70 factor (ECF subfamily)
MGQSVPRTRFEPRVVSENADAAEPRLPEPGDFDAIYARYFSFVWRSLQHLGLRGPALDDAAQDVFLVAHQKLEGFEGRSSLKTWLFGITHIVALGYFRRQKKTQAEVVLSVELVDQVADPRLRPEQAAAARLVQRFLDTLDEAKRAVFILSELEEFTAPEIAEALGIKLNTVYSRLRAARALFARAIAESETRDDEEAPR